MYYKVIQMVNKEISKTIRFAEDDIKYLEEKAKRERRKLSDSMRCELLRDKDITGWNKNKK